MKHNDIALIIFGLFLATGLVGGGYFIGQTMYNAKVGVNTAESKGLSERRVKADQANWTIGFSLAGNKDTPIASLYNLAESNQKTIIDLLKENNFTDDEIKIGVINYRYDEFRGQNKEVVDARKILNGTIVVSTAQVENVDTVRAEVNKLLARGINIQNKPPRYIYTRLNDIKPAMLKEASQNARIAANEFAKNAGAEVGAIRTARQGNFFIRDAGEEYGDDRKIEKDVRVVTTITFFLND